MNHEIPLVEASYLLQKFPGKGGWTYAEIPEILQNKDSPFGWVKVKGSIDGFELKQYKLMPMGNGKLFLPVKSEIRKRIKKQEGDFVRIILWADHSELEIPLEIIECLQNESPLIQDNFNSMTDGQKKAYLDWIYNSKTDDTKANRIIKMMTRLERNLKFSETDPND